MKASDLALFYPERQAIICQFRHIIWGGTKGYSGPLQNYRGGGGVAHPPAPPPPRSYTYANINTFHQSTSML